MAKLVSAWSRHATLSSPKNPASSMVAPELSQNRRPGGRGHRSSAASEGPAERSIRLAPSAGQAAGEYGPAAMAAGEAGKRHATSAPPLGTRGWRQPGHTPVGPLPQLTRQTT